MEIFVRHLHIYSGLAHGESNMFLNFWIPSGSSLCSYKNGHRSLSNIIFFSFVSYLFGYFALQVGNDKFYSKFLRSMDTLNSSSYPTTTLLRHVSGTSACPFFFIGQWTRWGHIMDIRVIPLWTYMSDPCLCPYVLLR